MSYISVAEDENLEPVELPCEPDGTMLLSTINAQYASAIGLKYRNPQTNTVRGVRLSEGRLFPPEEGWGNTVYFAVFPKSVENTKRKGVDETSDVPSSAKTKKLEKRKCTDLIVLGLSYKATDQDLREYFERFGSVIMTQVKMDHKTNQSRGYGFVRYNDYESQEHCLREPCHMILDRKVSVKVPDSQQQNQPPPRDASSHKIFVGRTTEDITAEDLRAFFGKYGKVTDVFVPKPFRSFAFVTFADADVAESLCGEDYIIKGVSVHVGSATPKGDRTRQSQFSNFPNASSPYNAGGMQQQQQQQQQHSGPPHTHSHHSHHAMNNSPAMNGPASLGMSPGAPSNAASWPGPPPVNASTMQPGANPFANAAQASYAAAQSNAAQFSQAAASMINPQMMAAFAAQWQSMMQNPAAFAASLAAAAAAGVQPNAVGAAQSTPPNAKNELDGSVNGGWPPAPPPPPGNAPQNAVPDWRKNAPQQTASTWWPQQ